MVGVTLPVGEQMKDLIQALQNKDIEKTITLLQESATKHAGTAPALIKNRLIKHLQENQSKDTFFFLNELSQSQDLSSQEIAAIALTDYYVEFSDLVNQRLYQLADSDHWEVREWVASACGRLLALYFDEFLDVMTAWSTDPSENIRRAAILGIMYAAKTRNPSWIDPFLDILENVLPDPSVYVRKNLGPFAIGSALISYYPEQVLNRAHKWVTQDDEWVRWNTAMIFSAVEGAKWGDEATDILKELAKDSRPSVQKALQKANKVMAKVRKKTNEESG